MYTVFVKTLTNRCCVKQKLQEHSVGVSQLLWTVWVTQDRTESDRSSHIFVHSKPFQANTFLAFIYYCKCQVKEGDRYIIHVIYCLNCVYILFWQCYSRKDHSSLATMKSVDRKNTHWVGLSCVTVPLWSYQLAFHPAHCLLCNLILSDSS